MYTIIGLLRERLARHIEASLKHKQVIGLTLLAFTFSPLFLWTIQFTLSLPFSLYAKATYRPPAGLTMSQPVAEKPIERFRALKAVLLPGSNVYSLLVKTGLDPGEVQKLVEGFAMAADLRKCQPGEIFTINQRTDGSIASVIYEKGPLEVFSAEKLQENWRVTKKVIPFTSSTERLTGEIKSSLFMAVSDAGESDALAIALIDVLAWEIDFAHESQPGDRFTVLYEKHYVGDKAVGHGPVLAVEYVTRNGTIRSFSLKNAQGGMDYFNENGLSLRKSFLKSPLRYSRITSGFTSRRLHPVTGKVQPHYAIDYAAPTGTPIWSVADGTVRSIGQDSAAGRKIIISHGGYESYYLHLSQFAKGLAIGKKILQKQVIGYVGSSGLATGPHLDYRLAKRGRFVNPLQEQFPRAEPVPSDRVEEFKSRVAELLPLLEGQVGERMAALTRASWHSPVASNNAPEQP